MKISIEDTITKTQDGFLYRINFEDNLYYMDYTSTRLDDI